MTSRKIPIAVADGDGIGPEIMGAVRYVLDEAGANLEYHPIEIGEKCYLAGMEMGMSPLTWDVLRNTKALLKSPVTTPQGGGYKSLNVTIRSTLGLYANVRPSASYAPFVETKHPKMDIVIVRENEEDLYTGVEYRQTPDLCEAIKMISSPGSEKIIRFAFEYARSHGRKKVSCFTKDNILKLTDGLFHKIFEEIAAEYHEIETEHWIIDIGTAKLADNPEVFDVLVLPNLYGDILSDVAAQLTGSVGLGGSANIGENGAMFEAIHGSAPKRAGTNSANPSGLLLAAVLMLNHLGVHDVAERIHNAWLKTIEEGIHTYDIFREGVSKKRVGTKEFADAVAKFLGQKPQKLKAVSYHPTEKLTALSSKAPKNEKRVCVGVDVYLYSKIAPNELGKSLAKVAAPLTLKLVTNRGAKVWPEGLPETFCIDQFRARFSSKKRGEGVNPELILGTLKALTDEGFDIVKTENLYLFDGKPGFSTHEIY
ncbi:MAG: NADP-dependent isocitrate dehydrogenase [Verrucomicrobia bacterium]|nr:NADP-dependent isocitrate dehydrogenase [Verrucomicrobiota bacterium]